MDERVERALAQWPDVPDVYGWLSLDSRGRWRLRGEPISNRNLIGFINRNYLRTPSGSYAFQNGPQRVHVELQATPFIVDLADAESMALDLHTGDRVESLSAAYLDEAGQLILVTDRGPALVRDQALPRLLPCLAGPDGQDLNDTALEAALASLDRAGLQLRLPGHAPVPVHPLVSSAMELKLGFIRHPERSRKPES